MQNQFHTRLLLLFLSTTLVIAGCIAFGAKKIAANKTQQPTQPDLLALVAPNQTTCPKILKDVSIFPTEPFYFSYLLETTEQNCAASRVEDLFGEGKLFGNCKDCTFVLDEDQSKKYKNIKYYQQYYKGIEVSDMDFLISYANDKIYRTTGRCAPHLNIDTTGMLSKEEAAMLVLKERNTPAEAYKRAMQRMFNFYDLKVDPIRQRITYSFRFIVGEKSGIYVVDALTGLVESHTPYKFAHVSYKCADDR